MPFIDQWPEYEVCKDGTIKSRERYVHGVTKLGKPFKRLVKARILKPRALPKGHLFVSLWRDNKEVHMYVHRLVAEKYIPNPDNLPCVLHADDNPANNHWKNLRWGTHQDNVDDMFERKRNPNRQGIHCGRALLTEEDVIKIRKLLNCGMRQADIGALFGVARNTIGEISRGVNWSHI
jgi:hypothetical protein